MGRRARGVALAFGFLVLSVSNSASADYCSNSVKYRRAISLKSKGDLAFNAAHYEIALHSYREAINLMPDYTKGCDLRHGCIDDTDLNILASSTAYREHKYAAAAKILGEVLSSRLALFRRAYECP